MRGDGVFAARHAPQFGPLPTLSTLAASEIDTEVVAACRSAVLV